MNKEIEDKVKELSRRIVGTGQIVVTAESLTGGMISGGSSRRFPGPRANGSKEAS